MPFAQQLGRYQLLDRLAFGGMAEIFRAKTFDSQGNAHLVAVKKVLGHLTSDDEFIKMLVDEAKVSALLHHENIARVYEFAHTDEEYFLAMEYVDGKDVRTLLERHRSKKKPVPPEHVAWIISEVACALNAAHTQVDHHGRPLEIVHRDVSPSNVLCSYNGEVKLCDFGIAKATLTRVQTKTGVIKGKVKYMSPEQAMGRKLDGRSDLFSLGSVMYEMLTLHAPFTAPTEVELIFAVRDAVKRDAMQVVRDIPVELNQICNKLMTRSRSGRYQNGEELAIDLRAFLESYRPGYKRSHFGRFMRKIFEADIERELRLLEEYVIDDGADPEEVGENLIADALGANAPYTKFTAASHAQSTRVGSKSSKLKKQPDLHAEQTRLFDPSSRQNAIHGMETRIFDTNKKARGFDEVTTGQRQRHSPSGRTPLTPNRIPPSAKTPLTSRTGPTPITPRTGSTPLTPRTGSTPLTPRTGQIDNNSGERELPRLATRINQPAPVAGKKFHDAKTQIIQRPPERKRHDTQPSPPPKVIAKHSDEDFDEEEETMLPLSDDDLLDP